VCDQSSVFLPNPEHLETLGTRSKASAARPVALRVARWTAAHDEIVAQTVAEPVVQLAASVVRPAAPLVVLRQQQRQRQH